MSDHSAGLIRSLKTEQHVAQFASRLHAWLLKESSPASSETIQFPESRAQALLRAAEAADDETITAFRKLVSTGDGARTVLHDLLEYTKLAESQDVAALTVMVASAPDEARASVPWLSMVLASHARQREYPLAHLDPASPPQRYSPAGQVVNQSATFLRQQIRRSTTDRARLAKSLAPQGTSSGTTLEALQAGDTIPPLPPHFRSPIPVRYPEVSRETLQIEPDQSADTSQVTRGEPLVISDEDLREETTEERQETAEPESARRMPPIRIAPEQVRAPRLPSPVPSDAVLMPANPSDARSGLTVAIRQMFNSEELLSTKLRVVAQIYPDGPGLFGLQVKISCKGIKSFVAGTTDRDGQFLAELPVKQTEGLTYDVAVTWPRDMGGETERKSMTLHADRTEFLIPFYHRLEVHGQESDRQSA